VEPLDGQVRQEFGHESALSAGQRERHRQQRREAIRGALGPERFQAYLLTEAWEAGREVRAAR
jgi:hypothetical protein